MFKTENYPGVAELSQKVLEARKAERKLHMLKDLQVQHVDYEFGDNAEIDFDCWIPAEDVRKHQVKEHLSPLTLTQMEENMLIFEECKQAHEVIKNHD